MQTETIESILKKAASKEHGSYMLYKNASNYAKDAHTRTILNKFAEEELKHKQAIEDFNIEKLKEHEIKIDGKSRQGISEYLTLILMIYSFMLLRERKRLSNFIALCRTR